MALTPSLTSTLRMIRLTNDNLAGNDMPLDAESSKETVGHVLDTDEKEHSPEILNDHKDDKQDTTEEVRSVAGIFHLCEGGTG